MSDLPLYTSKPFRPGDTNAAKRQIDGVIDAARLAGVDLGPKLTDLRSQLDQTNDLITNHSTERREAVVSDLADRYIADDLTADDLALQAALAAARAPGGLAADVIKATESALRRKIVRELVSAIDGDAAFSECRKIVESVIADVGKLRKPLGVADLARRPKMLDLRESLGQHLNDRAAARSGADVARAWGKYRELVLRWDSSFLLAQLLRDGGWLPPLPSPVAPDRAPSRRPTAIRVGRRYDNPAALDRHRDAAKRRSVEFLELLDPASDDAVPVLPQTPDEEVEWLQRTFGAVTTELQGQRLGPGEEYEDARRAVGV